MVAQHLPVVLAALFDVDNHDLLQPKRPLRQDIELHQSVELPVWPRRPKLPKIQEMRSLGVDVLFFISELFQIAVFAQGTHHAKGPEKAVVNQQPCLLAKTCQVFALRDALRFRQRRQ